MSEGKEKKEQIKEKKRVKKKQKIEDKKRKVVKWLENKRRE